MKKDVQHSQYIIYDYYNSKEIKNINVIIYEAKLQQDNWIKKQN